MRSLWISSKLLKGFEFTGNVSPTGRKLSPAETEQAYNSGFDKDGNIKTASFPMDTYNLMTGEKDFSKKGILRWLERKRRKQVVDQHV